MTAGPGRARSAVYWAVPPLLCLLIYWRCFTAWFRADDFAWLGTGLYIQNTADFLHALFGPLAQGTIRPLSERIFFMAGYSLFGLNALPFRIVIFATEFANLALVAAIGARISSRRAAGLAAALLWLFHGSVILPLGWVSCYNQVLCGFFLLLAFWFLLRFIETGRARFERLQWLAFLLGFGALEWNVIYPAIAAGYTLLCARKHFRRTLPMFAVSAVYVAIHQIAAPTPQTGDYAMHWTGSMLRTFATYWTWSVGPTFLWTSLVLPAWLLPTGVAILSIALLAFLVHKVRAGERAALFCLLWFVVTLAPVLPLRDHITEYYVYLPRIGLCWLAGWALAEALRSTIAIKATAAALVALYGFMTVPQIVGVTDWNYRLTVKARNLVSGVATAHELHPKKSILLADVDTDQFWNAVLDRPFRLFGADNVYLAPGSERTIEAHPDLGRVEDFILPADVVARALDRDELVVYDAAGPQLRNITAIYAAQPQDRTLPRRIDAASPLVGYLLGPEWYAVEGDHRWMPKRATLRIGGPASPAEQLYLRGQCPEALLKQGDVIVTIAVDGSTLPPVAIHETAFEIAFPLPASVVGKPEMQVAVEVSRVLHPAEDPRDLSLVFGLIEVR
jgi:hypothetical protein